MTTSPMTTPTDADRSLVTVIAVFRARPGREDELRAALEAMVGPSRQDPGFVTYDLHQGTDDPAYFAFYENWTSEELLDRHGESEHVRAFTAQAAELLAEPARVDRVRRIL